MKKLIYSILFIALISSCNVEVETRTKEFENTTKEFVNSLIKEDYDKCIEKTATEIDALKNVPVDTLKASLVNLRTFVIENFGTDLEYKVTSVQRNLSTSTENGNLPNTTTVLAKLINNKENYFGEIKLLYDDKSSKIINFNTVSVKQKMK